MFNLQGMDKSQVVLMLVKLYKRQVYVAAVVIVVVALALKDLLPGAGAGAIWSLVDTLLIIISVIKGFEQMKPGRLRMQVFINFLKRLAVAVVMLYLVHRFHASVLVMLCVFALMHLALVVNLLIFTRRSAQKKVS